MCRLAQYGWKPCGHTQGGTFWRQSSSCDCDNSTKVYIVRMLSDCPYCQELEEELEKGRKRRRDSENQYAEGSKRQEGPTGFKLPPAPQAPLAMGASSMSAGYGMSYYPPRTFHPFSLGHGQFVDVHGLRIFSIRQCATDSLCTRARPAPPATIYIPRIF